MPTIKNVCTKKIAVNSNLHRLRLIATMLSMSANSRHKKKSNPPNLLRGLFSIIVIITGIILVSAWLMINFQIEQLVATRTSEYAHSIAQVAANSSTEALLSKNKQQLQRLVENVAKDQYIQRATVYAEDGQIVAQYPQQSKILTTTPDSTQKKSSAQATAQAYLEKANNIPFIEKITHEKVTIGWFKVTLERQRLESSFRLQLNRAQNFILLMTAFLFIVLLTIILRFNRKVKELVLLNHRLIQINASTLPDNSQQWMQIMSELSETRLTKLPEHSQLPKQQEIWLNSRRLPNITFCYCQFAMQQLEDEQTAHCLSLAENYLQSAIQAHGLQSQGNILSGCLIPLFEQPNKNDAFSEALALIQLVTELLNSLTLAVTMRAFVGSGVLLTLENERAEITGISLSNRLAEKIYQLTPHVQFGETAFIGVELDEIATLGQFESIDNQTASPCFRLLNPNQSIEQQVSRQVSYLMSNNY